MVRREEPSVRPETAPEMAWGSDAIAAVLGQLELPYLAINPGSSYRGLHDSVVNYMGNSSPQLLLCLHEEHAVAIAHGYAKVTERPMGVAVHSNVGLMHATMAIYNAYCDRVPMLVLGATGPVDASARRPWIDWLHTAADQGALVRNYTKWDDQPASVRAGVEAVIRADKVTRTYPCAPTYVCLDVTDQEAPLAEPVAVPELARRLPPSPPPPDPVLVDRTMDLLRQAERPVLLVGRVGRSEQAWRNRVRLAESLQCRVLTDLKVGAGFPSDHPLNPAPPATFLSSGGATSLAEADLIVSLDWVDLGGTLAQAFGQGEVRSQIVSSSMDFVLHNGWSKDHFRLPPVDIAIPSHPDLLVDALCERLGAGARSQPEGSRTWRSTNGSDAGTDLSARANGVSRRAPGPAISMQALADELNAVLAGRRTCLVRLPLGWEGADLQVAHPLDYLGQDGGAGIGSGPGMTVGAALALAGTGRMAVGVLGDGDFLMGASALWTAAHYRLPVLVVVANNRSFMNDEIHQERVATERGRPVENRWLGQQIRDPDPDLAALAGALGLLAHGPVVDVGALRSTLERAVADVEAGGTVVVDVRIESGGYATVTSA